MEQRINVAYIRTYETNDEKAIIQKTYIDNYANFKNIKINHYYIDRGYSGNQSNRPELNNLLSDIKNNKINSVIITGVEKITRNITDLDYITDISLKNNVSILTINDDNITEYYRKIKEELGKSLIDLKKEAIK